MDRASRPIQVTVWGENRHEQKNEAVREIYPDGTTCVESPTGWFEPDE